MTSKKYRILIADPEKEIHTLLIDELKMSSIQWEVDTVIDGEECLRKISEKDFDVIILELNLSKVESKSTNVGQGGIEPPTSAL